MGSLNKYKGSRMVYLGLGVAVAMILGYIDRLFPLYLLIPIPGVKLGLSNIVLLLGVYILRGKEVYLIMAVKVILLALLFGNPISGLYSIAGGFLSVSSMLIIKRVLGQKVSPIGVSVAGAVWHNIGQVTMAVLIMSNYRIYIYLSYLIIIGMISGVGIGILANGLSKYKKILSV